MNSVATLREGLQWINSVCTFRRYDDGGHIVLVGTTRWFLPTGNLVLQDYNWTVISPSATNSKDECVIRNCYRLETPSGLPAEIPAHKMIFDLVGNKMRIIAQSSQDILLSRADKA